jgi:hypothetical protein
MTENRPPPTADHLAFMRQIYAQTISATAASLAGLAKGRCDFSVEREGSTPDEARTILFDEKKIAQDAASITTGVMDLLFGDDEIGEGPGRAPVRSYPWAHAVFGELWGLE